MKAHGQIVVGVDGSIGGRRALHWAVQEAARLGVGVDAVIAWRWDTLNTAETISSAETDEAAATLGREVASLPQPVTARIEKYVYEGRPSEVLAKAAQGASMLVLGSHGHSHRLQEVLGSVTEECIRSADCPVVVIPAKTTSIQEPGSVKP